MGDGSISYTKKKEITLIISSILKTTDLSLHFSLPLSTPPLRFLHSHSFSNFANMQNSFYPYSGKEFSVRYNDDLRQSHLQVPSCPSSPFHTQPFCCSAICMPQFQRRQQHTDSSVLGPDLKLLLSCSVWWSFSHSPVSSKLSTQTSSSRQLVAVLIIQLTASRSAPYN